VLEGRATSFAQVRPDLPSAIGDVITRAMQPDPARRFQSCDELADAYGAAIGVPSKRKQIAAQKPSVAPMRPRKASSISNQNLQASKGSTLALDLSAAMEQLPGLKEAADLALSGPPATPQPARPSSSMAPIPPPLTPPPATFHNLDVVPPPYFDDAGADSFSMGPDTDQQNATPGDPYGEHGVKAQGGDTLYIHTLSSRPPGAAPGAQSAPGMMPLPPPSNVPSYGGMQQAVPSQFSMPGQSGYNSLHQPTTAPMYQPGAPPQFSASPPTQAPKKRMRGVILFFVAAVIVIILSALGGFAVRAYRKGELELPFVAHSSR
jgi:hypothetical protein